MQQLLQIENIPIKLEIKSTRAKFEKPDITEIADLNSSAGNYINVQKRQPITSNQSNRYADMDVYENSARNQGLSYSKMMSYASDTYASASSVIHNMTATPAYVQAGIKNAQAQVSSKGTSMSDQIALRSEAMQSYSLDKMNFDLNIGLGNTEFEFVPGSVEFKVAQRPEVRIEYVGSPIYAPPSSAPGYVDTLA